jgi:hypothetical protein
MLVWVKADKHNQSIYASRNSLTSRSRTMRFACWTWPLAGELFELRINMFSSASNKPNCVMPDMF